MILILTILTLLATLGVRPRAAAAAGGPVKGEGAVQ
jgi:hypothetical protein